MVDTPMLKKIKVIQLNELRSWKGMQVDYISWPGTHLIESSRELFSIGITNLFQNKKL